ncbi:hypothetical protein QTH47_13055 [Clostridium perfringens]|jgi:hypothetical protein|nr:hypothetical protein [Clostridium perfringens]MDM0660047.1 hypothetical protein [Clostridium perfringens]
MNNDKIYDSLTKIKDEIKDFKKYNINNYHHERYFTQSEGLQICDFMVDIIENIHELIDNIEDNTKENDSGLFD